MKVLVTGATGFVGQAVVRKIAEGRHSIRILTRRGKSPLIRGLPAGYPIEIHRGDVMLADSLHDAAKDMDAVVHLVGIISQVGSSTFENVHFHGTCNILESARSSGVRRFIHMSALGTRPKAASRYHQTKWAAEEAVRASALDYTIFRPSLIFGPQDQFVNLFARLSRYSPLLPIMGTGRSRFQPIAIQDVASAFAQSLSLPAAIGRTLDLCGPETLTFEEMLDQIVSTLGRKRLKVHLPLGIARLQAAILEWGYPTLLNRAPPFNRDQLLMLQEDNVGRGEDAIRLFGLEPVRFRDGIEAYLGGT